MSRSEYEVIADTPAAVPEHSLDAWYEIVASPHFWMDWRNRVLLNMFAANEVPLAKEFKVMDIGCGNGVVIRYLEEATAWSIDGVEMDVGPLSRSHKGRGRLLLYDLTRQHEAFAEAYDLVYLLDVLEHIKDQGPFLNSVLFHLKPGGYLVVGAPALQGLFGTYDRAAGHYRRYDRRTLPAEFKDFDVDILDVRYWGLSLVPVALVRELLLFRDREDQEILRRGFAPRFRAVNGLFSLIMRLETSMMKRPLLGASIMLLARKRRKPFHALSSASG